MKVMLTKILLTTLLSALGIGRPAHATPHNRVSTDGSPLQHATRLTYHGLSYDQYYWLSDHEILFIRGVGKREDTYEIIRKDIQSGRERKLAKLSALFNATKLNIGDYGEVTASIGVDVSPDHHWLLWYDRVNTLYAARLDGSGYFHCEKSQKAAPEVWSPDGKSIGSVAIAKPQTQNTWVELWSVRPPHAERHWDIALPDALFDMKKYTTSILRTGHSDQEDVNLSFVGFITRDRLLISKDLSTNGSHRQITLYSLSRSLPDHKYVIRLPRKVKYVEEVVLSPDKKRLAWLANYTVGRQRKAALWICHPNGSGMREIGTLTNPTNDDKNNASSLKWTPDGRHVSLFYNQAVWVIPVGRER